MLLKKMDSIVKSYEYFLKPVPEKVFSDVAAFPVRNEFILEYDIRLLQYCEIKTLPLKIIMLGFFLFQKALRHKSGLLSLSS